MEGLVDHYLYLSSEDSKDVYPKNEPWDFTVDLPQTIQLGGKWELALLDLKHDEWLANIFVLCDWCGQSTVRCKRLPVLRMVSQFGLESKIYYVPVIQPYLARIHITIKGHELEDISSFATETTTCTLHLRKCRG